MIGADLSLASGALTSSPLLVLVSVHVAIGRISSLGKSSGETVIQYISSSHSFYRLYFFFELWYTNKLPDVGSLIS